MQTCNDVVVPAELSRRGFLAAAGLGGGAALLSTLAPGVARAGQTEALLLSCMDYRLLDELAAFMEGRGLKNRYDHVIVAGASLGALTDRYPAWGETFWGHLDVAIQLHNIHRVVVIDHRDCGAYKVILGEAAVATAQAEHKVHAHWLEALRAKIGERHPHLAVECGLMALDGSVEMLQPALQPAGHGAF